MKNSPFAHLFCGILKKPGAEFYRRPTDERKASMKNFNWKKALNYFVFLTLVASIVFVTVAIIRAPTAEEDALPFQRVKGDYVLMLLQCIIGVFAMLLPGLLRRRLDLIIPSNMLVLYALFLYCAIYLGEVRSFYYTVPYWDTILHTFSGAMLGALGFSVINFLNKTDRVPMNLSPIFVVFFAFCFAVTMGVVWEIYEFTADGILGTNMQKFGTESGIPFPGREALIDTMQDLIVDSIGALVMSALGYVSLKHQKGWVEKLQLRRHRRGHS